jgi:hypothetical protein
METKTNQRAQKLKTNSRHFYWLNNASGERFDTVATTRLSAAKKAIRHAKHRDLTMLLEGNV